MSDLEQRIRTGLDRPVTGVDADDLLAGVVRGVSRRRRRRTAVTLAAAAVLVGGTIGTVAAVTGDGHRDVRPAPIITPTPTQPPLPEGARQGSLNASVADGTVFRLTENVGCVGCSTIWRSDATVDGGWRRLHDFGAEAFLGRPDPLGGPIAEFVMAPDGRNGFAWQGRLYATHDGGSTWNEVASGPGPQHLGTGYQVAVTDHDAWVLLWTGHSAQLWRSPLGSDTWTRADAPKMANVDVLLTIGNDVALQSDDHGQPATTMQYSPDGTTWGEVTDPCPGDAEVRAATTTAFLQCPSGKHPKIYVLTGDEHQLLDLNRWELLGTSPADDSAQPIPVGDLAVLIAAPGGGPTWLMTPEGTQRVDLGLHRHEQIGATSSVGPPVVVRGDYRLIASDDEGRTWHELD